MQRAANVTSGDEVDWHVIDWKHVYRTVKNLRQRIFRASRDGDLKHVRWLQRLMLKSRANALESVRRVTQVNHGKSTPGIDHVVVMISGRAGATTSAPVCPRRYSPNWIVSCTNALSAI
jgi:RNA-directed DNA polymerase